MTEGTVWKFGDNLNTDAIIAARYLNTFDGQALAAHLMEDIDPGFSTKLRPGDVIVGGSNFGCGSSREHAPLALKAAGVSAVIAASFARIFYRNAINIGLPILESSEAAEGIAEGDTVEVDLASGRIVNLRSGAVYQAAPYPEFMLEIIESGGLIEQVKRRLAGQSATPAKPARP